MSKVFVDTNILVYALQNKDRQLRARARSKLKELQDRDQGVISTQVMQEFFVVTTKKLGVDPVLTKRVLQKFENFEVVSIEPRLIYEAIDCSMTEAISFWDALIVAAAASAKCDSLWTEDLNAGQVIRDVSIVNPLL